MSRSRQSGKTAARPQTRDSFVNLEARLGLGADNLASAATYAFDFISRDRQRLEAAYRTSWIVGKAVDVPAEDMTRAGISLAGTLDPEAIDATQAALLDLGIWQRLADTIRWGHLYGGALAVLLVDGQNMATPLRRETVGRGQFKGLLVLDRWMVNPSMDDLVTEFGPSLGLPRFYDVVADAQALPRERIHHSRCVRIDGIDLPFYQKWTENLWGESVVERLYDRLTAFDSVTHGAGQLAYKAHLRVLAIDGLRDLIATGGRAFDAVVRNTEMIRRMQNNEGLTLIDGRDRLEIQQYAFSGLSDLILQFGQQISGALDIPLVRLFGQSPAGLNSSGDSDLRTYYDGVVRRQENKLRAPLTLILDVLYRSMFGQDPPPGFNFSFAPLWQTPEAEKATIAGTVATAVTTALQAGAISPAVAAKELRQSSRISGVFSNITDADIEAADDAPPSLSEMPPGDEAAPESNASGGLSAILSRIRRRLQLRGGDAHAGP
jgi:phage-related protein (TIGR01555 family)